MLLCLSDQEVTWASRQVTYSQHLSLRHDTWAPAGRNYTKPTAIRKRGRSKPMGDCEWVTFWGEWDIAITWSDSTLLKPHIVELPEISTRNFFGKQTQGNNKHAEISCSSLSPPDSGRHRKISLVSLSDVHK